MGILLNMSLTLMIAGVVVFCLAKMFSTDYHNSDFQEYCEIGGFFSAILGVILLAVYGIIQVWSN